MNRKSESSNSFALKYKIQAPIRTSDGCNIAQRKNKVKHFIKIFCDLGFSVLNLDLNPMGIGFGAVEKPVYKRCHIDAVSAYMNGMQMPIYPVLSGRGAACHITGFSRKQCGVSLVDDFSNSPTVIPLAVFFYNQKG